MKKSDIIDKINQYKNIIPIQKSCCITFDKHTFDPVIISDITLSKITDMKNAPNKRRYEDGKMKTPTVFQLNTNQGTLYFTLEDTEVFAVYNGARINIGSLQIDIRCNE